ncbi:MAG TPA: hypothetical protein VFV86_00330 [Nitrososphaeraceae archaeon]|nr:hypothetical protein [Nitrososphaeraceae archaeon]
MAIPVKLSTTIKNIDNIPKKENVQIIREFHQFMKNSDAGDKHINNNLKIVISFAKFSNQNLSFGEMNRKHIIEFLDSKINTAEQDPDRKWITTWNVYLNHLKYFFWRFHNRYI